MSDEPKTNSEKLDELLVTQQRQEDDRRRMATQKSIANGARDHLAAESQDKLDLILQGIAHQGEVLTKQEQGIETINANVALINQTLVTHSERISTLGKRIEITEKRDEERQHTITGLNRKVGAVEEHVDDKFHLIERSVSRIEEQHLVALQGIDTKIFTLSQNLLDERDRTNGWVKDVSVQVASVEKASTDTRVRLGQTWKTLTVVAAFVSFCLLFGWSMYCYFRSQRSEGIDPQVAKILKEVSQRSKLQSALFRGNAPIKDASIQPSK